MYIKKAKTFSSISLVIALFCVGAASALRSDKKLKLTLKNLSLGQPFAVEGFIMAHARIISPPLF